MSHTLNRRANHVPVLLAFAFRPFFLLTAFYAAALVAAWVAFLFGGLPLPLGVNPSQWHAHELLFGMVPAAIAGFLLTAMCNWTGASPLHGGGLLALVLLWLAGRVVMWLSGWLPLWLVAAVDLVFLPVMAAYVARVLLRHGNYRNLVLVVLLALLTGANLLMHLGFSGLWPSGGRLGEVLALDLIAVIMVVIGGRITPAFTANWLRMQGRDPAQVRRSEALDRAAFWGTLVMMPADLTMTLPVLASAMALFAALINAWRLYSWRGWKASQEPLVWILHLALSWVVVALVLKAMTPWLELPPGVWMHAMGAGAGGTLILGVMTRVAMGHTGRPMQLPRLAIWIYVAIIAAGLARVVAAFIPQLTYSALIGSALAWVVAFMLFVLVYWPILSRPRADGRPG
ncbi:NnrS family protein [Halomonas sp. HP20-15]|uniref:NnrS family protein n=1 Tax=Halomonas sp. HP20-15 TaxID=3085901 RepID=UPI002981A7D8|nr:NnrS family protein [Halomonas sp. HP20-15]MDW5375618.1 NnrS family protein [Halomonas sp. HP20-15]